MLTVLHLGRSAGSVDRLLSASTDPPVSVCNVPTAETAIAGSKRWRPDCWVCERDFLPDDASNLRRLANAADETPVLVYGDGSLPAALADRENVHRVGTRKFAETVLEVAGDDEQRSGSQSSSVLLSLLDRSAERVTRLDRDGVYRSVSDDLAMLFDASASTMVGTHLSDHAPTADADVLHRHGVRAIETGAIQRYETDEHRYLFVPDGECFRLIVREPVDGGPGGRSASATEFIDAVLNRLTDIFFIFDLQGRFLHWNDRLSETTGYTDEEIASMTPLEFFVREDYDRVGAAISEVVDTGDATEIVRIRTRDGELLPYEFTGSMIPDDDGRPSYVCGIARDVSQRRHAERALRERQHALSNLIRNLPGVVLRYRNEPGYPIEFMGQGCSALTGYSYERIESREISWCGAVVHPDDRDRVRARIRNAVEAGGQYQSRHRIRTADGALRWVWEQGVVVEGTDGAIDYVDSYVSEISDLVWARHQLRRERAFTESALDAQPDLFYVFTLDGRILRWNDRFAEVTGYADEEIASMHPTEFVADDDVDRVVDAMGRVATEKRTISVEATLVAKDGERIPYEFVGSVMEDVEEPAGGSGGVYICGTGRDITQRLRAEAELEDAITDLERSNAELERFAYVASHDLKEPLRTIHSYLDLVGRRYEDELDDDAEEFIEYATDGAERMRRMIDDLLTYSRIGTSDTEFDSVDCRIVLDRVLENLQIAIEEMDAEVTADALPTVIADGQQLVQLFQNLISNAISYASDADPRIHVSASETDDGWRFSVSDNGVGIEEEKFEEVFEIFSSGSNGTDSTGIGLAICKKIVARHGGEIWVESQPGVGSTFHFTIPDRNRSEADRPERLLDAR